MNPAEQCVEALISALPRKWILRGRVSGFGLGRNCFQFRFKLEEDLKGVLANRPYHFCHWMLVLQRWEPVISSSFPSQIPFWIRLEGLPLHYWHEQIMYNIAFELGTLEDYDITKSSAKIRLSVNALEPLVKEALIEFAPGQELVVALEYENLELHFSVCFSLSHLASKCHTHNTSPQRAPATRSLNEPNIRQLEPRGYHHTSPLKLPPREENFSQRVDRYGRPFGERIKPAQPRSQPLCNKLTPLAQDVSPQGEVPNRDSYAPSRPQSQLAHTDYGSRDAPLRHQARRSPRSPRPSQQLQWREKRKQPLHSTPDRSKGLVTLLTPTDNNFRLRPPLERNLATSDFPALPTIPTTEEVLNELREVIIQYASCADPVERAARQQRILQSETEGLMEKTAPSIIEAATVNYHNVLRGSSSTEHDTQRENTIVQAPPLPASTSTLPPPARKRGRPTGTSKIAKTSKTSKTSRSQASGAQKALAGASSRKRNLLTPQSSPAASSTPRAPRGRVSTPRGATITADAPADISGPQSQPSNPGPSPPPREHSPAGNQQDFPAQRRPLP